jgi:hypothetical protein
MRRIGLRSPGKTPMTSVRLPISRQSVEGLVLRQLGPVRRRERVEGDQVLLGGSEQLGDPLRAPAAVRSTASVRHSRASWPLPAGK